MREMKDSGIEWIGEVPKRWEISKIKYLVDNSSETAFLDGDWIESPYITDDGIPYFTTKNVGDGYFKKSKHDYITQETFKLLNCKYAHANDLVISRLNEPYGRSCILPDDEQNCVLAVDLVILRPKATVDKRYVCYVTQTKGYQNSVKDTARGTTMKRISRTNLGNINIPMPPINIQYQIADYLDEKCVEIDTLITVIEKQIEILEQYKKSVITETVTKGLDPNAEMKDSGIGWLGKIPKQWCCIRGKYLLTYLQKPVRANDEVVTCFRDGEVTLRSKRREDGFTLSEKEIGYQGVDIDDLVVHGMDGFAGAIGISDSRGKASPVLNILDTTQNKRYIMYYLRSMAYSNVFLAMATGIRVRSCDLRWNKLAELFYPVPPLKEQKIIVEFVDKKIDETNFVIANKKEQIETLTEYKKSLIYEYVTGKKEVPKQ